MDAYTLFLLSLITLSSIHSMKIMQKELLHNKVANRTVIYVSEIAGFVIYQGLMMGLLFHLSERFSSGNIVSACYVHIAINVAMQLLILKKDDEKMSDSHSGYFKWIWLMGVALYSGLFIIALQNLQNLSMWVVGTGIAHAFYNLSYFFFLYFNEKKFMNMGFRTKNMAEPKVDLNVRFEPKSDMTRSVKTGRKLPPIHKMYGEDYRKLKLEEVRSRNRVALLMFCLLSGSVIAPILLLLWKLGVPIVAKMAFLLIGLFLAGVVYLIYCQVRAEKNVKEMQIETVYEGMARVVGHPFIVEYVMPDGSMVIGQDFSRQKDAFPIGSFVKIMVKNGIIVRSVKEKETFSDVYRNLFKMDIPMKGKRLDKEMANAVRVAMLIMLIGVLGSGYCFMRYPNTMASEAREEEGERQESVSPGYMVQRLSLEEEISNRLEEKMEGLLRQRFSEIDDAELESVKKVCAEKAESIQSLACYDVLKTETQDYEQYIAKIKVTPAKIFQTLRDGFEEVSREKNILETHEDVSQMYANIVEESIERSMEQNTYGEEYVIEVVVIVSDGECELEESERKKLFEAIFP